MKKKHCWDPGHRLPSCLFHCSAEEPFLSCALVPLAGRCQQPQNPFFFKSSPWKAYRGSGHKLFFMVFPTDQEWEKGNIAEICNMGSRDFNCLLEYLELPVRGACSRTRGQTIHQLVCSLVLWPQKISVLCEQPPLWFSAPSRSHLMASPRVLHLSANGRAEFVVKCWSVLPLPFLTVGVPGVLQMLPEREWLKSPGIFVCS